MKGGGYFDGMARGYAMGLREAAFVLEESRRGLADRKRGLPAEDKRHAEFEAHILSLTAIVARFREAAQRHDPWVEK